MLLMEEILHQLVVYPYVRGFKTSQVVVWEFFLQQYVGPFVKHLTVEIVKVKFGFPT